MNFYHCTIELLLPTESTASPLPAIDTFHPLLLPHLSALFYVFFGALSPPTVTDWNSVKLAAGMWITLCTRSKQNRDPLIKKMLHIYGKKKKYVN